MAVDGENRRIYVGLPGDWRVGRDEAYLLLPGQVVGSGSGKRSTEITGVPSDSLQDLPELVADLSQADGRLPAELKDKLNESPAGILRIDRPGRHPLPIDGKLETLDVGRQGQGSSADRAEKARAWDVIAFHVDVLRVPDYLFANACYATPIKFRVQGAQNVPVRSVKVSFFADGRDADSFTENCLLDGVNLTNRTMVLNVYWFSVNWTYRSST